MKQFIITFILLVVVFSTKAQVSLNVQLAPAGFVNKDQLWNLILVNNKDEILDINIRMNMQDAISGQVVMSASTGNLLLGKGVKTITTKDLQPVTYNYTLPDMMGNYLPMGSYIICYQIWSGTKEVPLAEECIKMNIDPLSPPLLNSPANKSVIETPYPQFSWIPPAPFEMFSALSYELFIAEVIPGQLPAQAIDNNTPVYFKTNLLQPFESYASSFNKLDTGKIYAWQIVAKNGINYSAKSEIWTFSLASQQQKKEQSYISYLELKNNDSKKALFTISEDMLRIKYYSFREIIKAVITISASDGKILESYPIKLVSGDNFFSLPLSSKIEAGKIYQVALEDNSKKISYASIVLEKKN